MCQDDQVLFAYANSSGDNQTTTYLKLYGPKSPAAGDVTLTVTDGKGAPVSNVTVKDSTTYTGTTDADGKVTFTLAKGSYRFKADKADNLVSIRSNELFVRVH